MIRGKYLILMSALLLSACEGNVDFMPTTNAAGEYGYAVRGLTQTSSEVEARARLEERLRVACGPTYRIEVLKFWRADSLAGVPWLSYEGIAYCTEKSTPGN